MSEREVSREPMDAYIPPADEDERVEALPQQEEFWRPPVRFGTILVEKEPLGWDKRGDRFDRPYWELGKVSDL